jgi:hypothetical protein
MGSGDQDWTSSLLNTSDFLYLPFTAELTRAGIAAACRSLPEPPIRSNERVYFLLRRKVALIAAKLAFYRLIEAFNIAHRKVILKPFTNPDEPDISISGRRIEWVNFLISKIKSIERIIQKPESLLHMPMIVNLSNTDLELFQDEDLLCFSIALGKTTAHLSEMQKYVTQDENKYLCYPFPINWAYPQHQRSMGRLIMKSEHGPEMTIEMGGRDEWHCFYIHGQTLPEQIRIEIEQEFYSLTYLHVPELPAGRISIYSPKLKQTCTIHVHEWGNLWVYGSQIMLIGYISWDEFKYRAYEIPAGTLVMGEMRLPTKCQAIKAKNLHPIGDLIPNIRDSLSNKG